VFTVDLPCTFCSLLGAFALSLLCFALFVCLHFISRMFVCCTFVPSAHSESNQQQHKRSEFTLNRLPLYVNKLHQLAERSMCFRRNSFKNSHGVLNDFISLLMLLKIRTNSKLKANHKAKHTIPPRQLNAAGTESRLRLVF
jgi:hypothetical protein